MKFTVIPVRTFTELMSVTPIQTGCVGCKKLFQPIYFKSRKAYRSTKSGKVLCDECMLKLEGVKSLNQTIKELIKEGGFSYAEVSKEDN